MVDTTNNSPRSRFFSVLVLLLCVIVGLAIYLPNKMILDKFVGSWDSSGTIWVFNDGDVAVKSDGELLKSGSYSVKDGYFRIDWDIEGYGSRQEQYSYYFSADGQTLELHWVYQDGFMTLTKIK